MSKTPSNFEFADRTGSPGDGGRRAAKKAPPRDAQDPSPVEAFEEEGAGIAAKE